MSLTITKGITLLKWLSTHTKYDFLLLLLTYQCNETDDLDESSFEEGEEEDEIREKNSDSETDFDDISMCEIFYELTDSINER